MTFGRPLGLTQSYKAHRKLSTQFADVGRHVERLQKQIWPEPASCQVRSFRQSDSRALGVAKNSQMFRRKSRARFNQPSYRFT